MVQYFLHRYFFVVHLPLLFLLCFQPSVSYGELKPVQFDPEMDKIELGPHTQILKIVPDHLSIEDVSSPEFSDQFIQSKSNNINLGSTDSVRWFRFSLFSDKPASADARLANPDCSERLLYLGKMLDYYNEVTLFWQEKKEGETTIDTPWQQRTYGRDEAVRRGKREPLYIPISLKNAEQHEVVFYLRIQTNTLLFIRPILYTTDSFLLFTGKKRMFYAGYYGLVISMVVYNLFHFFFLRDTIRLIFILYAAVLSVYFAICNELFMPLLPATRFISEVHDKTAQFLSLLVLVFCIYFSTEFLEAKKNMKWIHRFLQLLGIFTIFCLYFPLFSYRTGVGIIPILGQVTFLAILIAAITALIKGYRPARFFLFGWIFFVSGAVIYILTLTGKFPFAGIGVNAFQAGSGIEMVLLSLAIADRVKFKFDNLYEAQIKREKQLMQLSNELIQTEERERRNIAGRLHDSLGQILCAVKLEIQLILKNHQLSDDSSIKALDHLDHCIQETRTLTMDLYPQVLYQLGLLSALCSLARDYNTRFGLAVTTNLMEEQCSLREELQLLLYRIVSELLHNVVKHAQAEHAEISYQIDESTVTVSVIDDGVGFSYSPDQSLENNSFGLFSIQEKINRVGGKLSIAKTSHGGSQVMVSLPLS